MYYSALANLVLVLHAAFVVFVLFGGLLSLRWRRLPWLHLPSVLWVILIELNGWICPLTPLENRLRDAAGAHGYSGGFIEHYLLPLVYPPGLTPGLQALFAAIVASVNIAVYGLLWRTRYRTTGR
ncbi:MAG: DUF2784 domain-containing protein [Gammaproteobacteria bacterium]